MKLHKKSRADPFGMTGRCGFRFFRRATVSIQEAHAVLRQRDYFNRLVFEDDDQEHFAVIGFTFKLQASFCQLAGRKNVHQVNPGHFVLIIFKFIVQAAEQKELRVVHVKSFFL